MNITLINDLIDQHGDNFTSCKGCSICNQIASLRGPNRSPEEKYKRILDKGHDMTKSDIANLLDYGIQRRTIRAALEMGSVEFQEMMTNFGFSKRRVENVAKLTKEEYKDFKAQGLKDKEIAAKKGLRPSYLSTLKKSWTEEPTPSVKEVKNAEYKALIEELDHQLFSKESEELDKDELIDKLKTKVAELEGINSACDDVESELESLREERDRLHVSNVENSYTIDNQEHIIRTLRKILERYENENKVLRKLVAIWA